MEHKGPLPPTYLIVSIVAMVGFHLLWPGMQLLPFPWNLFGILFLAIGCFLNLTADAAFKKRQTTVKPSETSSALVTDGVFRVTRNPMYLGFVLILVGIGLFMGSLTPFAVIPLLGVLMDVMFIRAEERMLEEEFGDRWVRYKDETRRWV